MLLHGERSQWACNGNPTSPHAFENIPEDFIIDPVSSPQPNTVLGVRKHFNPNAFKSFVINTTKHGASLLGGCCEIKPKHIKSIKNITKEL